MADTFQFELVTPERLAVSAEVEMVEVPGELGDFGVLAGHAPFMSMIRPGVVTVHQTGAEPAYYFIPSGYAEVNTESCTVLAEHVRFLSEVNAEEAAKELELAQLALRDSKPEMREKAERAVMVAEALLYAVNTLHSGHKKH